MPPRSLYIAAGSAAWTQFTRLRRLPVYAHTGIPIFWYTLARRRGSCVQRPGDRASKAETSVLLAKFSAPLLAIEGLVVQLGIW